MNSRYRTLLPIVGITVLLSIVIGLAWLGTEIQSIHYTNRLNHNDWMDREKQAVNYLHNYLLSQDSVYYRQYREISRMLDKRVRWGRMIIDPSREEEQVVSQLSQKTSLTSWQIWKSILVNRKLQYFDPIKKTVHISKQLTATLGALDTLGREIHEIVQGHSKTEVPYQKLDAEIDQLRNRINRIGGRLNGQYDHASSWMQKLLVRGTAVFSGFLLLVSIMVILLMNQKQRNSEQRLRKRRRQLVLSKKKFRKLFDNSPLAIAYLDDNQRIVQVNGSFEQLFGYAGEEIAGHQPDERITPAEKQAEGSRIDRQTLEGEPVTKKTVRQDREGNRIHVIITTVPVVVQEDLIGFFAIFTDITQQVNNQKELRETIQDREVLIQEIHHRVKNNLAIISGLLFMQSDNTRDPTTEEHLQDALSRIQSMALVHEQLYRQTESDAHINMNSYLPKLIQSIRNTSESLEDELQVHINAEKITLPLTWAVPVGLLTTELLMNVFKHAFHKGTAGRIEISFTTVDSEYHLSVCDNGIGLPEDFSMDSDSLGMNIINNLVKQIDGEVDYSTSKQGTCFTISFSRPE